MTLPVTLPQRPPAPAPLVCTRSGQAKPLWRFYRVVFGDRDVRLQPCKACRQAQVRADLDGPRTD